MPLFENVDTVFRDNVEEITHDETLKALLYSSEIFAKAGSPHPDQLPTNKDHTKIQEYADFALSLKDKLDDKTFNSVIEKIVALEKERASADAKPFFRQASLAKAICAAYANQSEAHEQQLLEMILGAELLDDGHIDNFKAVILDVAKRQIDEMSLVRQLNDISDEPENKQTLYAMKSKINSMLDREKNRIRKKSQNRTGEMRGYLSSSNVFEAIGRFQQKLERYMSGYNDPYTRTGNPMPVQVELYRAMWNVMKTDLSEAVRHVSSKDKLILESRKLNTLFKQAIDDKDFGRVEVLIDQFHLLSDISQHLKQDSDSDLVKELETDYKYNDGNISRLVSTQALFGLRMSSGRVGKAQLQEDLTFLRRFFKDGAWDNKAYSFSDGTPAGVSKIRDILEHSEPKTMKDFANLTAQLTRVEKEAGSSWLRGSEMKAVYAALKDSKSLGDIVKKITENSDLEVMINSNEDLERLAKSAVKFTK